MLWLGSIFAGSTGAIQCRVRYFSRTQRLGSTGGELGKGAKLGKYFRMRAVQRQCTVDGAAQGRVMFSNTLRLVQGRILSVEGRREGTV